MTTMLRRVPGNLLSLILSVLLAVALATPSTAQQMGRVEGTVVQASNGEPVGAVRVAVVGRNIATVTGTDGSFVLLRVPAGQHTLLFRWLGFQAHQETVTVTAGATQRSDVRLQPQAISLGDVIVSTASLTPERVVEAPAAIAVVDPVTLRDQAVTGQAPRALQRIPGVDVVQSGINDFNVNARGFNSSLNRRILVMQDGRDLAIAFLGAQEWNAISQPLDDVSGMEMVRGPGRQRRTRWRCASGRGRHEHRNRHEGRWILRAPAGSGWPAHAAVPLARLPGARRNGLRHCRRDPAFGRSAPAPTYHARRGHRVNGVPHAGAGGGGSGRHRDR